MELSALSAISPIDGRYGEQVRALRALFGEYGLIRHRVLVEIGWFRVLSGPAGLAPEEAPGGDALRFLEALAGGFDLREAARVKAIEGEINHDVKAVEYYLRERMGRHPELSRFLEVIHFACTSEDVNNLAYALMLKTARADLLLPAMDGLVSVLRGLAREHAARPMLARTHGQPASPTTLGKELAVFAARLRGQRDAVAEVVIRGKMNGAVGNYNAHLAARPDLDWPGIAEDFVKGLGLAFNPCTTQAEPHDWMAELFHAIVRFNTVLLDFCRDAWTYVSLGYFRQRVLDREVGSSTMPHKINPIDFENAEGNLGVANALLAHLATKLPVSRLQRDLSDSTALRNAGVALAHSLLAYRSCRRGLGRLEVDEGAIESDLEAAWEVLAEPVQTLLRHHGAAGAYERIRRLTRGRKVDRETLDALIGGLPIPEDAKERLRALTPRAYTGCAERLAKEA